MLLLACPWSLDTAVSISSPSVHPSQHAHARHGRDLHLHVQRRDNRDARESSVGWSLPPRRRGHIHAGGRILGTADSEESRHLLFSFYGISSRSKPFLSDSLHSFRFVWATAKEQIWAAVTVSPCLSKPPGLSATLLGPCLVSYFSKKRWVPWWKISLSQLLAMLWSLLFLHSDKTPMYHDFLEWVFMSQSCHPWSSQKHFLASLCRVCLVLRTKLITQKY